MSDLASEHSNCYCRADLVPHSSSPSLVFCAQPRVSGSCLKSQRGTLTFINSFIDSFSKHLQCLICARCQAICYNRKMKRQKSVEVQISNSNNLGHFTPSWHSPMTRPTVPCLADIIPNFSFCFSKADPFYVLKSFNDVCQQKLESNWTFIPWECVTFWKECKSKRLIARIMLHD